MDKLTSTNVCNVASVGLSMIRNRIYLYEISDGPGLVNGETIDPAALVVSLCFIFLFSSPPVAATNYGSIRTRVNATADELLRLGDVLRITLTLAKMVAIKVKI